MNATERTGRNEVVIYLRKNGEAITEIARAFGLSKTTVGRICHDAGVYMGATERSRQLSLAAALAAKKSGLNQYTGLDGDRLEYIKGLIKKSTDGALEYVSGYTNTNGFVTVRCTACGHVFKRSAQLFRASRNHKQHLCPKCDEAKQEQERLKRQRAKEEMLLTRQFIRMQENSEQIEIPFGTCLQCGKVFVQQRAGGYCSDRCRKTAQNRRKDRRLNESNIIDKDITLEKLYNRGSGVCYICGIKCDWADKKVIDGTVICGDNYPSIEHFIPLSRGGKHSWDNVKLACRGCNTAKRNKMPHTQGVSWGI